MFALPSGEKNWIIGYCNSREKWWGEAKANEYNRGELTLHPEQENPGTGMARGGQARANTGVLADCRSPSASCYRSRQSSLVLRSSFWSKRRHR